MAPRSRFRIGLLERSTRLSGGQKWAVVMFVWTLYTASLFVAAPRFVFWPIIAIAPVMITTWLCGTLMGGMSALAVMGLHTATWPTLVGRSFVSGSGMAGSATLFLIAVLVGRVQSLVAGLADENAQRRATETQFRAIFDHAPIPLAMLTTGGEIRDINRAGGEFFGYEPDQLIGRSAEELTAPEDWNENSRYLEQARTGAIDSYVMAKTWIRSDGTAVHGVVKATRLEAADGSTYVISQILDLTDQIKTEEALRAQLTARDAFLAAVSHELRTPLTAVTGLAHELRDRWAEFSEDERHELMGVMADQSDEVTHLVDDLLVAARSDQENLALHLEPLKVSAELDLVASGLTRRPVERIDRSSSEAVGDRLRVRQVLRNLLENASRYGGDDVRVIIEDRDGVVAVRVCDDGNGVPADKSEQIFEPYARAHERPSEHGAAGLGLSVSRRLARLMNGDLTYRRLDETTVFELTLPRA